MEVDACPKLKLSIGNQILTDYRQVQILRLRSWTKEGLEEKQEGTELNNAFVSQVYTHFLSITLYPAFMIWFTPLISF